MPYPSEYLHLEEEIDQLSESISCYGDSFICDLSGILEILFVGFLSHRRFVGNVFRQIVSF